MLQPVVLSLSLSDKVTVFFSNQFYALLQLSQIIHLKKRN